VCWSGSRRAKDSPESSRTSPRSWLRALARSTARFWPHAKTLLTHPPHQPLHTLAVDHLPLFLEPLGQSPAAQEGMGRVLPVDPPHQPQVLRRLLGRLVVQAGAAKAKQGALPPQAQLPMVPFDQRPQLVRRAAQLFF
jgi:hypothetical protein